MSKVEEIYKKIDANIEVLKTLPKNNKKNVNSYLKKVDELKKEYTDLKNQLLKEMEKRLKNKTNIERNSECVYLEKRINNYESILYLLSDISTAYEKMWLDEAIQNLSYYYKRNLEIVNKTILYSIKKFEEAGIVIKLDDFCYSKFVKEYMRIFFQEMHMGDVYSDRIKNKFENIFWRCPDVITHIELNIRYLYLKNEKEIEKYYENKVKEIIENDLIEEIFDKYIELKKDYIEKNIEDKAVIITSFIEGKLNPNDYFRERIKGIFEKFVLPETFANADDEQLDEICVNIIKLGNSVYECENYFKFKFIIDDMKSIYNEKEKYKNGYEQIKKEITAKENTIMKLNDKIEGKGILQKPDDSSIIEQNNLILEVKKLYKDLDRNRMYRKIHKELNDTSSIGDVLYLASLFYNYMYRCIKDTHENIEEEEIQKLIKDLKEFVNYPYCNLVNNIGMLEEKDILIIVQDRYQLSGIKVEKQQLELDNLENLISDVKKIEMYYNIMRNKIDMREISCMCDFKKILNSNKK